MNINIGFFMENNSGIGTLFRKPIGMAFFRSQVLLKSSETPEFRNNLAFFSPDYPEFRRKI
jgi:hypothetical protein